MSHAARSPYQCDSITEHKKLIQFFAHRPTARKGFANFKNYFHQIMAEIYPSLQERFKNEGICPICVMPMGLSPKYACENNHTICHRCKPYYYSCPSCRSPMNIEILPPVSEGYHMPPPMHYMPHPYPPYPPGNSPSAPFIEEERHSWAPPIPSEDQELEHCGFCYAGCEARFPEHLRHIHESRCQFRPNLEENKLPTDLDYGNDEDDLQYCRYCDQGCNVRLTEWRKVIHEKTCIYKDRVVTLEGVTDRFDHLSFREDDEPSYDPEELVDCAYQRYGCNVRMPRRRKSVHEEKCNWAKCAYDVEDNCETFPDEDPDERVACKWAEYGCQVAPRRCRKETHEEKCNYRMDTCAYSASGCDAVFQPSRRYMHEKNCEYA